MPSKEGFARVFGYVSGDSLKDKKKLAADAVAALLVAIQAATDAGAPQQAIDFATTQHGTLKKAVDDARPNDEGAKASWNHYDAQEKLAKKATVVARSLKIAAEKKAGMVKLMNEGGAGALDSLVEEIGDSAVSEEDRGTIIAAMQVRYGLDAVAGILSTKAVPRLYKALGMAPDKHTLLNESLKIVERTSKKDDTSDYGSGKIRIQSGEAGRRSGNSKFRTERGSILKLDSFDSTTLHEVGHAVDEDETYMNDHGGEGNHGEWKIERREKLVDVAYADMGFDKRWKNLPEGTARRMFDRLLSTGKIEDNTVVGELTVLKTRSRDELIQDQAIIDLQADAVQHLQQNQGISASDLKNWITITKNTGGYMGRSPAVGQGKALVSKVMVALVDGTTVRSVEDAVDAVLADVANLEAYPTDQQVLTRLGQDTSVKFCLAAREKATPWYKNDAVARLCTSPKDKRIYWQAYDHQYVSFAASARARRVSDYSMRAPGEWFAEAYALFFMGHLPTSHALYKKFEKAKNGED